MLNRIKYATIRLTSRNLIDNSIVMAKDQCVIVADHCYSCSNDQRSSSMGKVMDAPYQPMIPTWGIKDRDNRK